MAEILFQDDNHLCVAYSDLVEKGQSVVGEEDSSDYGIEANQFLVVNDGRAALIDPGGNLTYNRLLAEVSDFIDVRTDLAYLMATHQDPDIISSMNKWLVASECIALVSELYMRFVPHFCNTGSTRGRLEPIPDEGMVANLGGGNIIALPAHFMHAEANFSFYDPHAKILFSGDIGASLGYQGPFFVEDFDAHTRLMKGFHQRYMTSNRVSRFWVRMVRGLEVEMIVPQHGGAFRGANKDRFLNWLENLPVGVDLMNQNHYRAA